MLDPQLVEVAQRLPSEIPDLRVVALRLEFGDDDYGQHERVFREAENGFRIREQDRGIKHISAFRGGYRLAYCLALLLIRWLGHIRSIPE